MLHSHPHALLIDDHDTFREAVTELLQTAEYTVESAADGQLALSALRSGFPAGIIVLDLEMPVMNGFEFRSLQLADPALSQLR